MSLQNLVAGIGFCVINFVRVYYRMFIMVGTKSVIDAWDTVKLSDWKF